MPEPTAVYQVRTSGLWNKTHALTAEGAPVGVVTARRNRWGVVVAGRYAPTKGEVLDFRRNPGLLRSQFSLWTEGKEWLCSSLRWSFVGREIVLYAGSKPLKILPLPGFSVGWSLQAPRTGEMARIRGRPWARTARIEVFRKVDFELVVFAYFLASQIWPESLWPGPAPESLPGEVTPSSKPEGKPAGP